MLSRQADDRANIHGPNVMLQPRMKYKEAVKGKYTHFATAAESTAFGTARVHFHETLNNLL